MEISSFRHDNFAGIQAREQSRPRRFPQQ